MHERCFAENGHFIAENGQSYAIKRLKSVVIRIEKNKSTNFDRRNVDVKNGSPLFMRAPVVFLLLHLRKETYRCIIFDYKY